MQLFYNPQIQKTDLSFVFDKEESKHIVKVLRKNTGDILHVTNGNGYLFTTEISVASDSKCMISIQKWEFKENSNYRLHIAIAPTKMNERLEWFLEKATEIGIHEITPIICENSERKIIKIERLQKIIESAMKQSLQVYLPKLNEPISFKQFIYQKNSNSKYIAHCEETTKNSFKEALKLNGKYIILIGPEGDFSGKEIQLALDANYYPVTLGETRLRTETAALVACHSVAFFNE